MQVISASYRTDIPAFYGDWFMNRIREGYVRYKNPYGPQVVSVSLNPTDVHAIVFWSKNYKPFMKYLDELEERGYRFYFHYTITGQPRLLEERVPHWSLAVQNAAELARRFGPKFVQWRYDPIVFSQVTNPSFHIAIFRELAQRLEGVTERCYLSFLDFYSKVARNLQPLQSEMEFYEESLEGKLGLLLQLEEIARSHGISLYTCAEDFAAIGSIKRGACVDKDILDTLWPSLARPMKLSRNRNSCGCYDSRDIGAYDTCPHGCQYCYAVLNRSLALQRYEQHDPIRDCLIDIGENQPPEVNELIQLQLL